ncbi:metallophosphoesterase, partial [Roseburia hominis]|nr:metallophosphoesterase [Roseburia hominis]
MRFLHTADWHIGKKLHDFSLAEDQAAAFDQIERLAKDYQVDAVVIAGDLYDRGLASEQAVEQLNGMLKQLNL